MSVSKILFGLGVLATLIILSLCVWASDSNVLEQGRAIAEIKWGLVSLVDLYAGFVLTGALVMVFERDKRIGAGIALAVLLLGNLVTGAWLAWRGPEIVRRLAVKDD